MSLAVIGTSRSTEHTHTQTASFKEKTSAKLPFRKTSKHRSSYCQCDTVWYCHVMVHQCQKSTQIYKIDQLPKAWGTCFWRFVFRRSFFPAATHAGRVSVFQIKTHISEVFMPSRNKNLKKKVVKESQQSFLDFIAKTRHLKFEIHALTQTWC